MSLNVRGCDYEISSLVQPTTRKRTWSKIGTSWKLLCWSSTPNPPTPMDRKRKMWWCSILHEVQLFITVSPRSNGRHKIFKHIQIDHIYIHIIFIYVCVCLKMYFQNGNTWGIYHRWRVIHVLVYQHAAAPR